jgi:hypothetical protein
VSRGSVDELLNPHGKHVAATVTHHEGDVEVVVRY